MRLKGFLERSCVAPRRAERIGWVLRVVGDPPEGEARRVPVDLALALDVSGSMAGEKLERVKEAACWLVRRLGPDDRLAIVTFSTEVEVLVPSGPVHDPDLIEARIRGLRATSSTNLSGGWSEALAQARAGHLAEGTNRVFLLTDGLANAGVTEPARLAEMTAAAYQDPERPVATSTFGVGDGFNEDLLLVMAQRGGGSWHYVDSADGAGAVFRQELADLQHVVAQNCALELRPSPFVKGVSQLSDHPKELSEADRVLTYRIGDVSAGTFRRLGLVIEVEGEDPTPELPLFSATLRYYDLSGDEPGLREVPVREAVRVDEDAAEASELYDVDGLRDLVTLQIGKARRKAVEYADRGDVRRAREVLARAERAVLKGPFARDEAIRAHLAGLQAMARTFREAPQTYGEGTRVRKELTFGSYELGSATVRFSGPGSG